MAVEITKNKNNSWIRGLDSIRFILALIVVLSHLGNPFHDQWAASSHLYLRLLAMVWGIAFSGVGAVMAFFIISGFVIHYPNREKYPDTMSFLIRRWLRIGLPLVVIALIAQAGHRFTAIPIWSLYCELIYYTIYPLLIRIRMSWVNKFLIAFLLSAVAIFLLASDDLHSLVHQKNLNYSGAYWQTGSFLTWIIGLPCWLLGVVLADQIDSYKNNVPAIRIWSFRILAVACGMMLDVLKFHFFVSYIFSMNLFALLLFFWLRTEIAYFRKREPLKWLEYSGQFSYSLYLCHNVIIGFLELALSLTVFTYFPILLITILCSYLFYLAVEKPSHLLSRKLAQRVRRRKLVIE